MRTRIVGLLAGIVLLLSVSASATPTLLTNGLGKWIGANHVDVNGIEYDLRFKDGTCAQVFGVCDQEHFAFKDDTSAWIANATIANMLVLSPFKYHPDQIEGCDPDPNVGNSACFVLTPFYFGNINPWGGNPLPFSPLNAAIGYGNYFFYTNPDNPGTGRDSEWDGGAFLENSDTSQNPYQVWALWTPSAAASVPEVPTLPLLGIGLACLALKRHG